MRDLRDSNFGKCLTLPRGMQGAPENGAAGVRVKAEPDAAPGGEAATEISSDGSSDESETESAELRKAAAAYAGTTSSRYTCSPLLGGPCCSV